MRWWDRSLEDLLRWLDSPAAQWLPFNDLPCYRQMAQATLLLRGSGSMDIHGRRVCPADEVPPTS